MYLAYGDARLLERAVPEHARVGRVSAHARRRRLLWDGGSHFGDWLAFATTRADYPGATTDKDLHRDGVLRALDRSARAHGARCSARPTTRARTTRCSSEDQGGVQREYVTPTGRVGANTQTAYVLALEFDLLPEAHAHGCGGSGSPTDVRERGHLTTGFLGTPYLCHVLSRYGYLDEAYMLLTRKEYPSWLYPVKQGATTIWERWDGQKPDGSFQDSGMNSFNHYAYGAIGDWMYRVMAGLDIDRGSPGYKHIARAPAAGRRLHQREGRARVACMAVSRRAGRSTTARSR